MGVYGINQEVYGDADPSLTYQVSGLKNGDSAGSILTGGLNRAAGENVGVYGINQASAAHPRHRRITPMALFALHTPETPDSVPAP